MDAEDSFVRMVDESFEKIEDVVFQHNLKRIRHMERRLEELERDLTGLIDGGGDVCDAADPSEKHQL
jgi:hypothetical protein